MAKIRNIFKKRQNFYQSVRKWFKAQAKFMKLFIIFAILISVSIFGINTGYLTLESYAATQSPAGSYQKLGTVMGVGSSVDSLVGPDQKFYITYQYEGSRF